MYHCKTCGHHINLAKDGVGYCPICDKKVSYGDVVPERCIDPVIKYCQSCEYGWMSYPDWVETVGDLDGCCFDSGCIYGLEDTQPTEEELEEFYRWWDELNEAQT